MSCFDISELMTKSVNPLQPRRMQGTLGRVYALWEGDGLRASGIAKSSKKPILS